MATLLQTIQNSLSGKQPNTASAVDTSTGGLFSTSKESLASLAKRGNQLTNASSPLAAATLGATPDSAKMAGSSSNLLNVIRQSVDRSERLSNQERIGAPVVTDPTQAQRKKQETEALAGLGNLQSRIEGLVRQSFQAPQSTTMQVGTTGFSLRPEAASAFTNATEEDLPALDAALEALSKGQATSQDILLLNQGMGRGQADLLSTADLKTLFLQSGEQQTASNVAESTADSISLGSLSEEDLSSLGFDSLTSMAEAIGIDPATAETLSLEDFQARVRDMEATQFSRVEELKRRATDPYLGQAERDEARRQLREAGYTGERAAEDQFEALAEEVQTASQIEFAGEKRSVQDILSDDYLMATVKQFLEDPDSAESLRESEPELAGWIEAHKEALAETTSKLDESVLEFKEIQDHNRELASTPDGAKLASEVMNFLTPGWDSLSTSKIEEIPPLLSTLKDSRIPAAERQRLTAGVTSLVQSYPNSPLLQDLKQMDYSSLSRLGILTTSGMQRLQDYAAEQDALLNINAKTEPEFFLSSLFGGGTGMEQAQEALKTARFLKNSGLSSNFDDDFLSLVDADGDGQIDDPSSIQERLQKQGHVSLSSLVASRKGVSELSTIKGESSSLRSAVEASANSSWMKKVLPLVRDGNLTSKEAQGLNLTAEEYENLLAKGKGIDPDVRTLLNRKYGAAKLALKERHLGPQGESILAGASDLIRYRYTPNRAQTAQAEEWLKQMTQAIKTMPEGTAKKELVRTKTELEAKVRDGKRQIHSQEQKAKAETRFTKDGTLSGIPIPLTKEDVLSIKNAGDVDRLISKLEADSAAAGWWSTPPDYRKHFSSDSNRNKYLGWILETKKLLEGK